MREQLGICAIALFNGIFMYPYLKKTYRRLYTLNADATHFVR